MRPTIEQLKAASREFRAANRRYGWHMRRHGRSPIEVIKRLQKAWAAYAAAIAIRGGSR